MLTCRSVICPDATPDAAKALEVEKESNEQNSFALDKETAQYIMSNSLTLMVLGLTLTGAGAPVRLQLKKESCRLFLFSPRLLVEQALQALELKQRDSIRNQRLSTVRIRITYQRLKSVTESLLSTPFAAFGTSGSTRNRWVTKPMKQF